MAYKSASRIDPAMLKEWEYSGQPKVVVKTDNEQELWVDQKITTKRIEYLLQNNFFAHR